LIQQELGQEMRRLRHRASRCGNFLSWSRRWNSPRSDPQRSGRATLCLLGGVVRAAVWTMANWNGL